MKSVIFGILTSLFIASFANADVSHHRIQSIGIDPAVACPGDEVQITVEVELHGRWSNIRKWGSTSIGDICYEHTNYQSNSGHQTFLEIFSIAAPEASIDLDVKTFKYDDCDNEKDDESVYLTVIPCPEDGIDCWDLNGNGQADYCHPRLANLFGGACPNEEDFYVGYGCEDPPAPVSKAMLTAKDYNSDCRVTVNCEEYLLMTTDNDIGFVCDFTEDINGDGTIDVLDCHGSDGSRGRSGSVGSQGCLVSMELSARKAYLA